MFSYFRIREIEKKANNGHTNSILFLGQYYQKKNNYKKAEEFYLKGTLNANSNSMNNLGCLYFYDMDRKTEGIKWLFKSAKLGNYYAMNNLGDIYFYEYNDKIISERWYIKSAKLGNNFAIDGLLGTKLLDKIDKEIIEIMTHDQKRIYYKILLENKKLNNIYGSLEDDCVICLEKLKGTQSSIKILVCGHIYHDDCVSKCDKCPICKVDF